MDSRTDSSFCNFRRLHSAAPRIYSPVALADGTLVTYKSQKLSRWKDHFSNLLNRPPAHCQKISLVHPINPAISCAPPSEEGIQRALNRLKNGKAPGICNVPPELLKYGIRIAWNGSLPSFSLSGVIIDNELFMSCFIILAVIAMYLWTFSLHVYNVLMCARTVIVYKQWV